MSNNDSGSRRRAPPPVRQPAGRTQRQVSEASYASMQNEPEAASTGEAQTAAVRRPLKASAKSVDQAPGSAALKQDQQATKPDARPSGSTAAGPVRANMPPPLPGRAGTPSGSGAQQTSTARDKDQKQGGKLQEAAYVSQSGGESGATLLGPSARKCPSA